jgi:hypothetical protein
MQIDRSPSHLKATERGHAYKMLRLVFYLMNSGMMSCKLVQTGVVPYCLVQAYLLVSLQGGGEESFVSES